MSGRRLPAKNDVLGLIAGESRPFHPREIAHKFEVSPGSFKALVNLLDDLVMEGALTALPGDNYKISKRGAESARQPSQPSRSEGLGAGSRERTNGFRQSRESREPRESRESRDRERPRSASPRGDEREGTLSVNQRGFGFVASPGASGDDVYVPKEALKGAMHGDKVVVQIRSRGSRGVEGEIVRVLDRGRPRVAGVLRRRGKSAWLEPDDTRIRGPIVLTDDIDAKGPEGNSGKDGDAAVVTITRWPELPDETPLGKLEAILGTPGELRVEVAKVLVMGGVEEVHSPEAFAEAEAYGREVPTEMLAGREDLTHLPLPTIDPEDARDHDDAVWVERRDNGGYRAWVAIADVSSYVRPGTALDAEALKRGCSIYLPDRAIPMLPRPLSSNLCSLLPDVVRLCLCVEVDLDAAGHVKNSRVVRGFMKSQAKLTYGGVARALGFTAEPPRDPKAEELSDGLRVANELSRLLRSRRMKRGALDFDLPEAKIILDDKGQPTDVQKRSQDPGMKKAYALIEELMLLANETIAEWLVAKGVPTIFRVHAPPDPKKLANLVVMCEALGVPFDIEDAADPKKLSAILRSFAEHPRANVLNMLLLRAMKQASYDTANIGHFGLASKAYLHFTSPIRRYPDLVVHRSVHDEVLGERRHKTEKAAEKLTEAAMTASSQERKAMEIEREVTDLYRAVLMRDRIGERYEGTVTGVVGTGIFCQLDSPFVDVLVRLEDLGAERWELDEETMRVVAPRSGDSLGLGERLMIEVVDVQILRRTVYGRRVSADGDERPARAARGGKAPKPFAPGGSARSGNTGKPWGKAKSKDTEKQVRAGKRKADARAGAGKKKGKAKGGKRKGR
jgi:ribonuclease R